MIRHKFKIGDKVYVTGVPPITFPPGVKDELGTRKPFKSMAGKVYTVRGFNELGYIELWPNRLSSVWIEPDFLKLRARRRKIKA
jgi:hypothetical protein